MGLNLTKRLRRNRKSHSIRSMVRETVLRPENLILPLFVQHGKQLKSEIQSIPGTYRWTVDMLPEICEQAVQMGIAGVAIFPVIPEDKKDLFSSEALNPRGVVCRAIKLIKSAYPSLVIVSDIALDPYSILGHDGLVSDGEVLNDETVDVLTKMALLHAKAGVDIVAPSDMMDGRVGAIRSILDDSGFHSVSILSYAAKYASSLYTPFRDALQSAPQSGDKESYQMDFSNRREAIREVCLDLEEGADIVMIKPGTFYLDIIREIKDRFNCPVSAFHVSGEYAMIKYAGNKGLLDSKKVLLEALTSLKRAGADVILTYAALEVAEEL